MVPSSPVHKYTHLVSTIRVHPAHWLQHSPLISPFIFRSARIEALVTKSISAAFIASIVWIPLVEINSSPPSRKCLGRARKKRRERDLFRGNRFVVYVARFLSWYTVRSRIVLTRCLQALERAIVVDKVPSIPPLCPPLPTSIFLCQSLWNPFLFLSLSSLFPSSYPLVFPFSRLRIFFFFRPVPSPSLFPPPFSFPQSFICLHAATASPFFNAVDIFLCDVLTLEHCSSLDNPRHVPSYLSVNPILTFTMHEIALLCKFRFGSGGFSL